MLRCHAINLENFARADSTIQNLENFAEPNLHCTVSEHGLPYTHSSSFSITDLTALSTTSGLARIKMALRDPPDPNLTNFRPLRGGRSDSELGDSKVHLI